MEGFHLQTPVKKAQRSASVLKEIEQAQNELKALEALRILGLVHYDLATYHSMGRFTHIKADLDVAKFHLEKAAACGIPRALHLLGCIYRQLPHTQFEDISVEVCVYTCIHVCVCVCMCMRVPTRRDQEIMYSCVLVSQGQSSE